MSNPTTIRLAKRLVDLAPPGLEHVFFSDDGATAVEVALKMAFQYWRQRSEPQPEKTCYVALDAAYHGDTLGAVSVGGVAKFHDLFRPLLFECLRAPAPDTYRLPQGITEDRLLEYSLAELERLLAEHHQRVAALVIEPLVQAAAGIIVHPPGYLRGVRELTRKYDVLMIADEVAVGFGRTGRSSSLCEHEGVTPDLHCIAKGLTGGYVPMAATLTTGEIYQAFLGDHASGRTFYHGHTYGGNPLAAAAAMATLDVFEEERTLEYLPEKIARLRDLLAPLTAHPHVGDIRQCGLIAGVETVRDSARAAPVSTGLLLLAAASATWPSDTVSCCVPWRRNRRLAAASCVTGAVDGDRRGRTVRSCRSNLINPITVSVAINGLLNPLLWQSEVKILASNVSSRGIANASNSELTISRCDSRLIRSSVSRTRKRALMCP